MNVDFPLTVLKLCVILRSSVLFNGYIPHLKQFLLPETYKLLISGRTILYTSNFNQSGFDEEGI